MGEQDGPAASDGRMVHTMPSVSSRYASEAPGFERPSSLQGQDLLAPVVLMVSGGADSTAMLLLAATSQLDIQDGRGEARIAREAAKQAFRPVTPEVAAPIDLNALCRALPGHQLALVPWEDAREGTLPRLISPDIADLAIVIGPEGGMGESEVQRMLGSGARAVTLGPRIFRTETAGLAAIIAAMALSGNLE